MRQVNIAISLNGFYQGISEILPNWLKFLEAVINFHWLNQKDVPVYNLVYNIAYLLFKIPFLSCDQYFHDFHNQWIRIIFVSKEVLDLLQVFCQMTNKSFIKSIIENKVNII